MTHLISCEFNMDTVCVELKFADGSMIFIDTIAWENEVADNMFQCSELDWLIYNKPLDEYSGQFYTVIPEVGNRRSDVKETVIPEPWKPWFLPL